jgi:hypothetical protein
MASRYVGMKGDLRTAIFVVFEGVEGWSFVAFGVEGGERFWMRAERRGVVDGESICRYYNIWWKEIRKFRECSAIGSRQRCDVEARLLEARGNKISVLRRGPDDVRACELAWSKVAPALQLAQPRP